MTIRRQDSLLVYSRSLVRFISPLIEAGVFSLKLDKRAQDGWRFVCIVPVTQRGTGHIERMDLVFEKQI